MKLTILLKKTLKIGAKLAGGYSFGFDHEYIGANIAYTKRSLLYANYGLDRLVQQEKIYSKKSEYLVFHEHFHELRNDIGVYVQELRDRFITDKELFQNSYGLLTTFALRGTKHRTCISFH